MQGWRDEQSFAVSELSDKSQIPDGPPMIDKLQAEIAVARSSFVSKPDHAESRFIPVVAHADNRAALQGWSYCP